MLHIIKEILLRFLFMVSRFCACGTDKYKTHPINHPFFERIEELIVNIVPKIELEDENKEELVRTFLIMQLSALKMCIAKYVMTTRKDFDIKTMLKVLDCSFDDMYNTALKNGIPSIFIDKYKSLFEETEEDVYRWTTSIFGSKYFKNDSDKLAAFLDLMLVAANKMVYQTEESADSFNGNLSKLLAEQKSKLKENQNGSISK